MITPGLAAFGTIALFGTIGFIMVNTKKGRRWIKQFFKSLEKKWEDS